MDQSGAIKPTTIDDGGFSHVNIEEGNHNAQWTLQEQSQTWTKMASESFEIWKQKYSWEVITKEYENLYLNLIAKWSLLNS